MFKETNFYALGFFAAITAVVLSPVLFFGDIFAGSDITQGLYPFVNFIDSAIAEGNSLLWSGEVFAGFPLFILGNFFNPFFAPLFLFGAFAVYHWLVFANVVLAGFFTYLFIKKLGLQFWPAVFGGLTFVIATYNWAADLSLASALPVLPLFFLVIFYYNQKPAWWKVSLGSLLVAYSVYSVNFNLLPILVVGVFLYSLFLGWQKKEKTLLRQLRLPLVVILMVVFGIILGLPQFLPTALFSSLSARAGGVSFQQASVDSLEVLDIGKIVLPYTRAPMGFSSNFFYFGALPSILFIFSWFVKKSSIQKFFLFLLGLALAVAIKFSPLFWLMSKLPLLDGLRVPGRWLFLATFSISISAAFGLHYFLRDENQELRRFFLVFFRRILAALLFVLAAFSLMLVLLKERSISFLKDYFLENKYEASSQLPIEHYFSVINNYYDQIVNSITLWQPRVTLPIIFLVISFFVLKFYQKTKLTSNFLVTVVAITALNFVSVLWFYHPTVSKADFLQPSQTVEFLQERGGRYLSFLPGFSEYQNLTVPYSPNIKDSIAFQKVLLPPNFSMLYGLSGADYYNNLMSRRMSRMLALVGSDRATVGEKLSDEKIALEEKVEMFESRQRILNILGVRFIISAYPLDESKFIKVLETSATRFNIPVYLYENQSARPEVYLADASIIIRPSEEEGYNLTTMLDLKDRDVLVECEGKCYSTTSRARGKVEVLEKKNGFWKIAVDSPDERWLVVSQNNLPGWSAVIDGEAAEFNTINSVFIGLPLSAGQHQVELKYHYPW